MIKPRSEYASRRGRPKQVIIFWYRKKYMTVTVIHKIFHRIVSIDCVILWQMWRDLKMMEDLKRSTWEVISMKFMSTLILRSRNPNTIKMKKFMMKHAPMFSASYLHRSIKGWMSHITSTSCSSSLWCFQTPSIRMLGKSSNHLNKIKMNKIILVKRTTSRQE